MKNYLKIISGSSNPALAGEICEYLDLTPGRIQIDRGPNDNIKVQIKENVREDDVFVVQTSSSPVNDHLTELLLIIDALKYASARRITAVLPYYPYVRSDKKDEPRISISARLVADLLQAAGADRILTMTLHSPQIVAFSRIPVDQLWATGLICNYMRSRDLSNAVVVSPDVGSADEASAYANRLDLPLAAAFATLMFAYGLRYLSIQMRLFQRQYLAFAELNLWSLTIQAMVWFYTLSTDGQMTAERAALTLAASEALVALVAWLRPTPEQPLAIGLLTHNGQDELFAGLGRWAKKVRADRIWAVDTGDRAAPWAESLNNDNFEFGGYLQLAQNMAESHEGPYLIFNDRLFYHRWSRGWSWLMRRRDLFEGGHYIAGDRHIESCGAPELAEAYLSSWVFYIPNRELLQTFINACEQAIAHDSSDESEAYQAFINTWLNATSGPRHRGARDQATLLRKAQTIRMEHALSAALRNQNVQLRNIPLYAGYYRSIDRIINRFR